jgi:hypothetical protein
VKPVEPEPICRQTIGHRSAARTPKGR